MGALIMQSDMCRWWPSRKMSAKQLLVSSVQALPYAALCASVLALGLVAGFILASPLAPQVPSSLYDVDSQYAALCAPAECSDPLPRACAISCLMQQCTQ